MAERKRSSPFAFHYPFVLSRELADRSKDEGMSYALRPLEIRGERQAQGERRAQWMREQTHRKRWGTRWGTRFISADSFHNQQKVNF